MQQFDLVLKLIALRALFNYGCEDFKSPKLALQSFEAVPDGLPVPASLNKVPSGIYRGQRDHLGGNKAGRLSGCIPSLELVDVICHNLSSMLGVCQKVHAEVIKVSLSKTELRRIKAAGNLPSMLGKRALTSRRSQGARPSQIDDAVL